MDKRKKQVNDIVNIFKKLDDYDCVPEVLMSAAFVKKAPRLIDPKDDMEDVSHKVKMFNSSL